MQLPIKDVQILPPITPVGPPVVPGQQSLTQADDSGPLGKNLIDDKPDARGLKN